MKDDSGVCRVLFVGHAYVVGLNQQKLTSLNDTGKVRLSLVAPRAWGDRFWPRRYELERSAANVTYYPSAILFEGRPGGYVLDPRVVIRAMKRFRPDIVHVEGEVFSLVAFELALMARIFRTPLSVFCWENVDRGLGPRRLTRQFVLRTASLIIAGGQTSADLIRRWGYRGPMPVTPQFGVDPSTFASRREDKGTGPFTIGYVGRLVHEKGVDLLLRAAAELRRSGQEFEVLIIGTGSEEAPLKEQTELLRLTPLVTWLGGVPHDAVADAMEGLDVLVLPSRSMHGWKEQFGHVLIEAMSMGIPVIGSDCGEIPNVIGRDDLIFREGEVEGLVQALDRLMTDPNLRNDVSSYCINRVQDQFTHERVTRTLLAAWENVLMPRDDEPKRPLAASVAQRLFGLFPPSIYQTLRRLPVLRAVVSKVLDAILPDRGFSLERVSSGPLKGMVLEVQPRVHKEMIAGKYESHLQKRLQDLLRPGDIAFDVGSHLGYLALVMARATRPSGKVVCLEPDPALVHRLSSNLDRNLVPADASAIVEPVAAGKRPGRALFEVGAHSSTGRIGDEGDFEVEVTTLDAVAERHGLPRLVKIDVEGGELDTLRGSAEILAKRQTLFIVEVHTHQLEIDCRALLERAGYRCERIHAFGRSDVHILALPDNQ